VVDYQWEFGDFRYLNAAYGEALPLKYISPIFPNDNIAIKVTSANVKPTWVFAGTAYQYENTILGESLTNETRLTLGRIHLILNILQPYNQSPAMVYQRGNFCLARADTPSGNRNRLKKNK
jgi:hypothetical protein